jgi:hypothetical protein
MPKRPPVYVAPGQHRFNSERERKAALDATRPNRHARGYGDDWVAFRAAYLKDHPALPVVGLQ